MLRHPLHPPLVHFPLALLLSATLTDLGEVAGLWSEPRLAAILMAGGLIGGLLAMAAGLADFTRLDEALVTPAMRHMAAVGLAWLGYAVALYLRRAAFHGEVAPTISVTASLLSALVLAIGGWLGGELVYRFGAGRIQS
jgi:uncharacterized membrane protein